MRNLTLVTTLVLVALTAPAVLGLNPDDELWIPAAARGQGVAGSFWTTDLYVMNLGQEAVAVDLTWLERAADNSDAASMPFTIAAGETLVLEDVVSTVFGQEAAVGAIHIEVEEEEGKQAEEETLLVANARIYSVDEGETYGQGFEGVTSDSAISAEAGKPTHVVGVTDNAAFRSNWYGLNLTMDDETDLPGAAEVLVEVLDPAGAVLASQTFEMPPLAPLLLSVSDLGAGDLTNATLRFTMVEGAAVFGVSKVDQLSNDPTTLEAHWECKGEEEGEDQFTDEFFIEDCTFATTGSNPFLILQPGAQLVLEGDDEGELVQAIATVLDETFVVDSVETRVYEERESVDGELEEVSRNYFAFCVETGSVFYFGEDVDIYEDGVIVSHEGAWRAGENGAEAGIIMPGTILLGARYQQETAPGVAMDRGEIVAMGLTVETEAGTFENCIQINDTNPLDAEGGEDVKMFCKGIGNVVDEDLELVQYTLP